MKCPNCKTRTPEEQNRDECDLAQYHECIRTEQLKGAKKIKIKLWLHFLSITGYIRYDVLLKPEWRMQNGKKTYRNYNFLLGQIVDQLGRVHPVNFQHLHMGG